MAVDFYLKLDSIQGESQSDGHTNEIQIHSFSWGASQTSSVAGTGGSGAGKAHLSDLSIMKTLDKASVPLFKALTLGTHIPNGTLTAIKATGTAGAKPFLKVTLGELFVTSLQVSGSSEIPMESVSFSYNTIKIEYSTQDDKGTMTVAGSAGWDIKTNKGS